MGKSFHRFTSRQSHWMDANAGRFTIPHICLGAYIIVELLLNDFELNYLLLNDFKSLVIGMSLMLWATVTLWGVLVIYFAAQATIRDSERYARHSYWLAIAYLCFSIGVVGISWTFLIGYAIVSLAYFAESLMLLVFARRTVRELREYR